MFLAHCTTRRPLPCIVPPHLLAHLARQTDPALRKIAEAAQRTLLISERLRGERDALGGIAALAVTPAGVERRTIYDALHHGRLPGAIARSKADPPVADGSVNEAFDGLGATYELYFDVYRRNSIDDRGMRLDATVHYRSMFNNAFWNGRQMVFGDGDGVIFQSFTRSLDVIGHELTHGVTQYEADLDYFGQSGALNEHISDVFGSLVKQFHAKQTAAEADWLIGAELFAEGVHGRALRSMKEPGTAYDDPRIGKDPQPAHMQDYVETQDDNGGVHINSGIPNRAFYLVARDLGGYAWQRAGAIWYGALTRLLNRDSEFADAAIETAALAEAQFGPDVAGTVRRAWRSVGVEPRVEPAARGEELRLAHQGHPERRRGGALKGVRG